MNEVSKRLFDLMATPLAHVKQGLAMVDGGRVLPILLLVVSNIFMTYAWYGHLKDFRSRPLLMVILLSWGVAFFEYCLQVPANRMGYQFFSLSQLKVLQEVITLCVFAVFSVLYMKVPLKLDLLWAGLCLVGAAFFVFRNAPPPG